ncbi:MAG: DNA-processing protein DprA [Caulobacteraceae bacterium]|nr:DNA-processing protein DprA [Caulobacteraceae bacterium]
MSPSLTEQERRDRLRLARTERVGPVAFRELLRRYGSAGAVLEALPEIARRGGGSIRAALAAEVEAELAAGEALGAKLTVFGDPEYSRLLAAVDAPPPVLWTLGDVAILARPRSVAVVGARIASAAAQRFARGLASELGQAGYAIISGLARGVDAAAHEGSLPHGTAAVLGGGVDDVYPPDNRGLYERIAAEGCIVSESPLGHRAQAKDFPRRNRIISGLSLGVVVVEAEIRSGSLITARLAGEQGREVFAVPGSPLDPRAKGSNDLIRQGAHLCEGAEDVLRVLTSMRAIADQGPLGFEEDGLPVDADLAELREQVSALLGPTPTPCDELVRATGARTADVLAALTELAVAGRADLLPGGLVTIGPQC